MRRHNLIVLLIAVVAGSAAALLTMNWLTSHSSANFSPMAVSNIVVAAKPLAFGTLITSENVAEISWSAKSLPVGAFSSLEEVLSGGRRVVLTPLEANEPILHAKVTGPGQRASLSLLVSEGKRAVTVRVDDVRGVAGFVLPGDFVDIVLIQAEVALNKRESFSEILLQHVRVLAIDQLANERQEQPTIAKAVTLEVAPEQAQKILLASSIGKLSLILRQPGEVGLQEIRRISEEDLSPTLKVVQPIAAPLPPLPPVAPPTNLKVDGPTTVKVAIIRNMKREEYTVIPDGH